METTTPTTTPRAAPKSLAGQLDGLARSAYVLTGVLVAAAIGFAVVVHRPAQARLASLRADIATKQQGLTADQTRASNVPLVKSEVRRLEAKLARFDKQLPPRQQLDQFIYDITQVSAQAQLRDYSVRPTASRRSELFSELPISLSFEGDFLGVCRFLREVEGMQRLTRVRSLSLRSKDGQPGQVEVDVSMNIYFSEG